MRRFLMIPLALGMLFSCNKTENNDPWGKVDPETAPKLSTVVEQSFWSAALSQQLTYSVWLPAGYDAGKTYPFLYLLHGYENGDQSRLDRCWLDKGNAARIADDYQKGGGVPMVIVMPNGLSSFYMGDYETYFEEELMPKVEADFHCNGQRAIAGLSMGGFGTLYHAIKYPSKFLYAYAMSPAADASMAQMVTDPAVLPGMTVEIGEQDSLFSGADAFVKQMRKKGVEIEYITRTGVHDWPFWKECLPKALRKAGASFQ